MLKNLYKMLLTSCLLLTILATQAVAQNYTQWGLPEGAKTRLGKGNITGGFAFSLDATRLAIVSSIGIWLYDTQTYQEITLLAGHTDYVGSGAFSADGLTLASGSRDGTIRLWNVATGEHKQTLTGHTDIASIVFSPDGETLASGGSWHDKTIRLWDAVTGEHKHTLTGHTSGVWSIVFSPDGRTLISRSGDNTIRLWNVATGEHKRTLTGHRGFVGRVAFSPDRRTLASSSGRTIHLGMLRQVNTSTLSQGIQPGSIALF